MADAALTHTSLAGLGALTGTAVTTKSGSTCTVTIGDTDVTVQVARDLTVAVGDVLLVLRQGSAWWAISRLYAAAPVAVVNDAAPIPKPTVTHGTLVTAPVETRSYRGSAWRTDVDDVRQGSYGGWGNHIGCAFYGSKLRSLSGATVTGAGVRVRRLSGGVFGSQTATLRLVTQATRPSGAPTLTSSTTGPALAVGKTGSFTVPTAWAQAMVDGTAGGLAIYDAGGSPYIVLAGRSDWAAAFTLTVNWSR